MNDKFNPSLNNIQSSFIYSIRQYFLNDRKTYYNISKPFILIIIFQILLFFYYCFYLNLYKRMRLVFLNQDQSIYVVSIVNTPNWIRSTNLWEKWGKNFVQKFQSNVFKFVSFQQNVNFSNRLLITDVPIKNYRGFFYLFNAAVDDFLHNTNFQWLYRTTEDCLVDIDLFNKYMEKLASKYSPLVPVLKGHAVLYSSKLFFVHGGSGWIMSRRAAQIYYDHLQQLQIQYNSNPTSGDDVLFGWFASSFLNLSFQDIDDPYFLGSPYKDFEVNIVRNQKWEKLPNCTRSKIDLMRPIKEIIFWHSGRRDNYPMNIGIKAKDVYPPNVYYDQFSPIRRLCMNRPI